VLGTKYIFVYNSIKGAKKKDGKRDREKR